MKWKDYKAKVDTIKWIHPNQEVAVRLFCSTDVQTLLSTKGLPPNSMTQEQMDNVIRELDDVANAHTGLTWDLMEQTINKMYPKVLKQKTN